jgi:predicted glycosyltransferase involved in capsule biosynthesis
MSSHKLGLIVPYRNREEHLEKFLPHMKEYLSKQGINHVIYIIEQEQGKAFNRAKLLNVGFLEADKDCDYFVMHDVDMLPQNVDYGYQELPTHLAAAASQFNYGLPYDGYFGGVTMFSRKSFLKINGYSNEYWGWGAEDDDVLYRCHLAGLAVQRQSTGILKSLTHDRVIDEQDYKKNIERIREMWSKKLDWENEGLNSCKYSVVERNETVERTLIKVSI